MSTDRFPAMLDTGAKLRIAITAARSADRTNARRAETARRAGLVNGNR